MASKPEIRVAEGISNQAENRWEKSAQNKLAAEIGDATKGKLEDLKDKIPVRVAEKGDTIGAIILGMKKSGIESLVGKNIWNLDVEYHSESGETKTLKLAQAAKLLPGDEVSFDGEKIIVKSVVAKKPEAEKQPAVETETQPAGELAATPEVAAQQAAKPAKKSEKQPAAESSKAEENPTPAAATPEVKAKPAETQPIQPPAERIYQKFAGADAEAPKRITSEVLNGGSEVRGKVAPKPTESQSIAPVESPKADIEKLYGEMLNSFNEIDSKKSAEVNSKNYTKIIDKCNQIVVIALEKNIPFSQKQKIDLSRFYETSSENLAALKPTEENILEADLVKFKASLDKVVLQK